MILSFYKWGHQITKEENKELHTISGKVKQTKPAEEKKKNKEEK